MDAYCSVCGKRYDMRDEEIRYHRDTGTWSCAGESACFARRSLAAPLCGAPNADPDGPPCQRAPHGGEQTHAAIKVEEWD